MIKTSLYKITFITAAILLAGMLLSLQPAAGQSQTFTTSGTFTVPAGVTTLIVECWGAGGGGGSSRNNNGNPRAGGGGGGGGYSSSVLTVVPGTNYSIVVGTGGAGGASNSNGSAGGNTTFNGTTVVALGGSGGNRGGNGAGGAGATSGTGSVTYTGGNGAAGVNNTGSGGGGGGAGSNGNGGAAAGTTAGSGTDLNGGDGGAGISGISSAGNSGNNYGGGGSGGYALAGGGDRPGGDGADGYVVISWPVTYYSQGSLDPALPASWNSDPGGSGSSPANFTANLQKFVIQDGHTMTTTDNIWTVSGISTLLLIEDGGVLHESVSSVSLSANTTFQIDNGGTLNHNVNSVTIFGGTESFGATSTVNYGLDGTQTVAAATYGNLTLSGTSAKTISTGVTVNGTLSIEGTASATGETPSYGAGSTLQYAGSAAQTTGSEVPATFSGTGGIVINNASGITLDTDVTVSTTLTMTAGNVITGSYLLTLSNGLVSSLSHTSGTIIGRFSRAVSTTTSTDYLFPVGTADFYRPAVMNFSSISSGTNITAEFVATPPFGFSPYTDGTVTLNSLFTDGYWRFSSSATPTVNYSLTLTADGFTSFLFDDDTRITSRDNTNTTWRAFGSHGTRSGDDISRTGITDLNTTSFDFALASKCSVVSLSYSFEREITIDHNEVAGDEDLFSFPVLINIAGEDFMKSSPAGPVMNANGYDIIFTDEDRNKLDHQIEYYNGTSGDLIAWVRIPRLSASENTVIRIMYGNSGITDDPSVTTVWDSHYKGVWHLNSSSLTDATIYDKSGTAYNSPTYPAGVIDSSLGLNGSNQYVQVINAPNTNFAGDITISAWVYMAAGNRDQKIAGNQNNSSGGYKFGIYTNNKVEFEIRNSANTPSLNRSVSGGTVLSTGQWYYLAGMSSDVLDSIMTFVNGVPERPFKKTGTLGTASDNVTIGREPFQSSYFFSGRFDELRISDKVRSTGWLRTEYNNQYSPSDFYTLGDEVSMTNLPSVSICDVPVTLPAGSPAGGTYSGNPYISGNTFSPPSAGTYSIVYTYTGACGPVSIAKEIIVTPVPSAPEAPDQVYCTGQIANLVATSGENIKWYSGGTLVSTANPFTTGLTTPGTYTYTVTQSVNGCESDAAEVTLTILTGIIVSAQPVAASVCEASTAIFNIDAIGYNMTYQWQEDGVNITDGGIYSGATTATLTIANAGTDLDGSVYRCVLTSSCGTSPVNSDAVALTVTPQPVATFSYDGSPYCPNASNALPTFSGGGVAGLFSSTAGLVFANSATGEIDIAASIPGTYTVTNLIAAAGGCGDVEETSPFEIIAYRIWTGAASTDWNNPGNWTCSLLPDINTPIEIPDVSNKPVLGAGSTGAVNDLTIEAGSSLVISGNTLQITGSIINNGTFTATSGTVEMNGSAAQSVPANTFVSDRIGNLIVNNPSGVSLLGDLEVSEVVTILDGELSSAGYLTLISDASGTALISGSGSGTVTGDVTMQRYLPSGFGYKYFSSPFVSATVGEFSDESITLIYRYDENRLVGGIPASGWVNYNSAANILNPLAGYAVNFGSGTDPKTVDITGEVNDGPLSVTIYNNDQIYTKGFNLVGNPYPSPIDWDLVKLNNTNIDDAIYYFRAGAADEYGGTYSSYVAGISSDGLATNIIPSMQGFFVHVSDGAYPVTGSLVMDNSVRISDLTHPFAKSDGRKGMSLLRLNVAFSDAPDIADPLVVYLDEKATAGYEGTLDALKLFNTDFDTPNFYSYSSDGLRLSINAMPAEVADTGSIGLGIRTNTDGEISMRLSDAEGRFATERVYLFDSATGVRKEMTPEDGYKVFLPAGDYNTRFFIQFSGTPTVLPETEDTYFTAYYSRGILRVNINRLFNGRGTITVTNIIGKRLFTDNVHEEGYHEFTPLLGNGIYIVSMTTGNIRISRKIIISK